MSIRNIGHGGLTGRISSPNSGTMTASCRGRGIPFSSSLPCGASANKVSKKEAMSSAGWKNWIQRTSSLPSFQKRCGVFCWHADRVSSAQLAALPGNLEDERPRDDLGPALLHGVDVDGLSFRGRRVHGLGAQQLGAKLDEGHLLTSTRIRDLLAFVRH